jgi:hypothetical protein
MAIIQTELGEYERPLILSDPELVNEMKTWRKVVEDRFGDGDSELVAVRVGPDGELIGVFRRKTNDA